MSNRSGGRFRGAPLRKNFIIMVNADKRTRTINSFEDVAIPSAKDLFKKYGKRIGNGQFAYDSDGGMPVCTSSAVIAQMQSAEKQVEYESRKLSEQN